MFLSLKLNEHELAVLRLARIFLRKQRATPLFLRFARQEKIGKPPKNIVLTAEKKKMLYYPRFTVKERLPGNATKKVKTTYYDDNGWRKAFMWPFSAPFNVVGE